MTAYSTITVTNADGACLLTLNRPERRNALTAVMMDELIHAIHAFAKDTSAFVLILTGAGEAFCSGLDLEELQNMAAQSESAQQLESERIARLMRTLYDCPKPTIAAVHGAAVAGGMGLATICDFTLAVPDARFGYPEVRIGFIPAIVSAFLRMQVGDKAASDLLLTGRLLDAAEAHSLGLVTTILPPDALLTSAHELAQTLMKNSPTAVAATKALLRTQHEAQLTQDIQAAAEANAAMRRTADFAEGLSAFLNKRKPVWPSRSSPS